MVKKKKKKPSIQEREIFSQCSQIITFWWKGHMHEKAEWFVWRHNESLIQCRSMRISRYIYVITDMSENYNKKDFRLYHDDGLGVVKIKEMKKNEKKKIYIYKRNKILKHRNNYKLATQKIEVP